MLIKTCLGLFLCISFHKTIFSAAAEETQLEVQEIMERAQKSLAEAERELHPDVQAIIKRTQKFLADGYTDETDTLARITTSALLAPSREATPAEITEMINAHLHMELYYAFNTKWGPNTARKHRIAYDFLSSLDKAGRTANQMEQITTFTVLSLAAQEFFWNEKSSREDLKKHVRRELRYGLFKKPGHELDIRSLVFLDGVSLERIIDASVTSGLRDSLIDLMAKFKGKAIGKTYSDVFDHLTTKLGSKSIGSTVDINFDLDAELLDGFGLNKVLTVNAVKSEGDGMCGEHSLFIPTDGPLSGISEGNGRYKIMRDILDQAEDEDARRLYLLKSEHMEGKRFIDLITREIAKIRATDSGRADLLQEQLEAYEKFSADIRSKGEESINASRADLITRTTQLPALQGVLAAFNGILNTPGEIARVISTEKGRRMLRNIVGEIVGLRTINQSLDDLLKTIDDQVQQLDIEANTVESSAKAKLVKETDLKSQKKAETRKALTDFCERENEFAKLYVAAKKKPQADSKQALGELKAKDTPLFQELEKLIEEAEEAIEACKTVSSYQGLKDAKIIQKYLLIGDTLKDFLNASMLPGSGHQNAFTVRGISTKINFITDFCQAMCEIVKNKAAKDAIVALMDEFQTLPELIDREISNGLALKGLDLVEALPELPAELTPSSLKKEMATLALGEGELSGWLPCDSVYTQLEAIIHNVNIFVFAGSEIGATPPLDLMFRLRDRPYNQTTAAYPYGTKGKNLATVILTSPTARNIFINKGPGHYDKFILPTDYAAMAAQLRHLEWASLSLKTKYSAYP